MDEKGIYLYTGLGAAARNHHHAGGADINLGYGRL